MWVLLTKSSHAYAGAFLTRQTLLQILYKHMGAQKDKVLTGKKVTSIEHHSSGVLARCADGSSFQGDIVVGADGVRSQVREQMWKHMDTLGMEKEVQVERESTFYPLPNEYSIYSVFIILFTRFRA